MQSQPVFPVYSTVRPKLLRQNTKYHRRACRSLDDILEDDSLSSAVFNATDAFVEDVNESNPSASFKVESWMNNNNKETNGFCKLSLGGSKLNKSWKSAADIQDTYIEMQSPFKVAKQLDNSICSSKRHTSAQSVESIPHRDSGCYSDIAASDYSSSSIYTSMDVEPNNIHLMKKRLSIRSQTLSSSTNESDFTPIFIDGVTRDDNLLFIRRTSAPPSQFSSLDRRRFKPSHSKKLSGFSSLSNVKSIEENLYMDLNEAHDPTVVLAESKNHSLETFGKNASSEENLLCVIPPDGSKPPTTPRHPLRKFRKKFRAKLPSFAKVENCPKVEQACICSTPLPPIPTSSGSAGVVEDIYASIEDSCTPRSFATCTPENSPLHTPRKESIGFAISSPNRQSPITVTYMENIQESPQHQIFTQKTSSDTFTDRKISASPIRSSQSDFVAQDNHRKDCKNDLSTPTPTLAPVPPEALVTSSASKPRASRVEYHATELSRYQPKQKVDTRTEEVKLEELDELLRDFDISLDREISLETETSSQFNLSPSTCDEEPQNCSNEPYAITRESTRFKDPVAFYKAHNIPLKTIASDTNNPKTMPEYGVVRKIRRTSNLANSNNGKKSFAETDDYAEITEDDLYNMSKRKFTPALSFVLMFNGEKML